MKNALVLVAVTILAISIWSFGAGRTTGGATAAQMTGPNSVIYCTPPAYQDTDLTVTLTTSGNPVNVLFNATAALDTNQGIALRPTIDGVAMDFVDTRHYVSDPVQTTLSFSRIYNVPTGTHTIKVQMACQGNLSVGMRWLSVYELK